MVKEMTLVSHAAKAGRGDTYIGGTWRRGRLLWFIYLDVLSQLWDFIEMVMRKEEEAYSGTISHISSGGGGKVVFGGHVAHFDFIKRFFGF